MTPEDIFSVLEKDIMNGAFAPGSALPQGTLAERFGVSRIPIRDALALLSRAGLVELAPNRRAKIVEMTRDQVEEAYDLRVLLECDLFSRALQHMTSADLKRIDYALERSDLEARNANWAQGDALFHAALYAPANRPRQQALIDGLRRACCVQIAAYDVLPNDTERWLSDHAAMRLSCHDGDTKAAVARLKSHLIGARDALLTHVR
jgi:DNA-binding GntR family transcriptional regulator